MGVEVGLTNFPINNLEELLPEWLVPGIVSDVHVQPPAPETEPQQRVTLESDVAAVEPLQNPVQPVETSESELLLVPSSSPVPKTADQPPSHQTSFMPKALGVPGILHIISNALAEVTSKLSQWETFWNQLKMFENLWKYGRLQRFIAYCVKQTPLTERSVELFRLQLGSLYLHRWNAVVRFCIRLHSVLPLIRATWNEALFLNTLSPESFGDFSPTQFSQILQSAFFSAYFDMILGLTSVLERIGQWAEACPCHEDLTFRYPLNSSVGHHCRSGFPQDLPTSRVLSKLFSNQSSICPMRGKRLPELVANGVEGLVSQFSDGIVANLFQTHRANLSTDEWSSVTSDLEIGKAHAILELKVKLDWVNRLPWKLAILAHSDEALSRREMQPELERFDGNSSAVNEYHHPLTLRILTGPIRSQLNEFMQGVDMQKLPDLLFVTSCFRFVQTTERTFEAAHAIINKKVPPNAAGPLISLQLRLLDFADDSKLFPELLAEIASHFDECRNIKQLPSRLGLGMHPELRGLTRDDDIVKTLNKVIYRADPLGQFPDVAFVDAARDKLLKKKKTEANKLIMKDIETERHGNVSYDSIRSFALQLHFKSCAEEQPDSLFSIPSHAQSVMQTLNDGLTTCASPPIQRQMLFSDTETLRDRCTQDIGNMHTMGSTIHKEVEVSPPDPAPSSTHMFLKFCTQSQACAEPWLWNPQQLVSVDD